MQCGRKSFKKANGDLLKNKHKAGGQFLCCAKNFSSLGDFVSSTELNIPGESAQSSLTGALCPRKSDVIRECSLFIPGVGTEEKWVG